MAGQERPTVWLSYISEMGQPSPNRPADERHATISLTLPDYSAFRHGDDQRSHTS